MKSNTTKVVLLVALIVLGAVLVTMLFGVNPAARSELNATLTAIYANAGLQ